MDDYNPKLRHLKVKIRSLAAEAIIIRHEERRTHGMERWNLSHHRRTTVRNEARHSLLAYAFLRGIPYAQVERAPQFPPDWGRVARLVERFGPYRTNARLQNALIVWPKPPTTKTEVAA